MAGDVLSASVSIQNDDNYDIKNARLTIMIPELGARKRISHIDIDARNEIAQRINLEIPDDAEPGMYDVLFTINDDDARRVKYRPILIR